MATVQGERIAGGCIVIAGIDSTQYAVRQQAVSVVHDADECHDERSCSYMGPCFSDALHYDGRSVAWFT
jgi:hypothetical protein